MILMATGTQMQFALSLIFVTSLKRLGVSLRSAANSLN
jgi:hypothetical protein